MSVVSEPLAVSTVETSHAPARPERAVRTTAFHGLVVLGLVLVAAGASLPWLSVYNGLTTIPGFRLGGGPLAGIAVACAGLVLVGAHRGSGRLLRPVAALGSAVVAGASLYIAHGVLGYVADPGPAGPLLMPSAGFGAYVMAAGAVALLASSFAGPRARRSLTGVQWAQLLLGAVTLAAGWVHLLLAPEHLQEHPLLGWGFIATGIAQVVLAAVVVHRASLTTLPLLVVLNVAVMAVYLYAVFVGLPFGDAGLDQMGMAGMDMHDDHGLVLGAGEPVDLTGAGTFLLELCGVGAVVGLVRHLARRAPTAG